MPGKHKASDQLRYLAGHGVPSYAYSGNFAGATGGAGGQSPSGNRSTTKAGDVGYGSQFGSAGPLGPTSSGYGGGGQQQPAQQPSQLQPQDWMYSYRFRQWFPKPQMYNMLHVRRGSPVYGEGEVRDAPPTPPGIYTQGGEQPGGRSWPQDYRGGRGQ